MFDRKIMRKIYGPTRTADGSWKIKTNQEINDVLKEQSIIGFIKKQRLNCLGHVERMTEENLLQKINFWKLMFKRPIGRPKAHCEGGVLGDVMSLNINKWKKLHRVEIDGRR
jgi:hypothetical protein